MVGQLLELLLLVEQPATDLILMMNSIQQMTPFAVRGVFGFKLAYILLMKTPDLLSRYNSPYLSGSRLYAIHFDLTSIPLW